MKFSSLSVIGLGYIQVEKIQFRVKENKKYYTWDKIGMWLK